MNQVIVSDFSADNTENSSESWHFCPSAVIVLLFET